MSRPRFLLTSWQDFGAGSVQSVHNLAEGLHERGHDVRVATPAGGVLGERLRRSGVPVVDFPFRRGWSPRNGRELAALVHREKIDLIDAQESRDRKAAILARRFFGVRCPLVISRRQLSNTSLVQSWLYGRAADAVVGNSLGVAQSIRGVPLEKVCVVSSGYNTRRLGAAPAGEEVEALRRRLGFDPSLPTVGVVARRKDQGALLRALAILGRPVNVLLVGVERDAELARLEAGLPAGSRTAFTGFVAHPRPYWHLIEVKVLPSYNEGLPQALFEAMTLGIPVVSSIVGGTPEMIRHGENGFLFENGDDAAIARLVGTLLDDAGLRARFVEAGRRTALEEFTVAAFVERTAALYEALLAGRPLPGRLSELDGSRGMSFARRTG